MILKRGLTLYQPFAWAIAHSTKRIENRPKPCRSPDVIGCHVAIHVSTHETRKYFDWAAKLIFEKTGITVPLQHDLPHSVIVAVARFDHCVVDGEKEADQYKSDPWWIGPVGYILSDVRTLRKPIAAKGGQGFWRLDQSTIDQIMEQVSSTKPGYPTDETYDYNNGISCPNCGASVTEDLHRGFEDEDPNAEEWGGEYDVAEVKR